MSVVEATVTDDSGPGLHHLYGLNRSVLLTHVDTSITFPSLNGYDFTVSVAA
jgi:hypothetical protein